MLSQMILSGGISVLEVIGSEAERCREMPKIIAEDRADGLIVIGDFSREYTGMLHSSQKMPIVELDTVWRGSSGTIPQSLRLARRL